ncbi:MAG: erythromycin esterase family protein, partial [Pseudonocardia sp.]|nr:erythromycin esterase family protein [Pseudonocardia sp.]
MSISSWPFPDDDGIAGALDHFLATRPTPPRVLALGEPTHGEEAFPRLRNAALRHLVAHAGFRAVAIESDALAGLAVDDHVCGGPGDLDDVMATGFSHGWGASPANRELVTWLREHNRDRAPADRVRFHGIDTPTEMMYAHSPRAALLALHAHLATVLDQLPCTVADLERLTGDDARWTEPDAAWH